LKGFYNHNVFCSWDSVLAMAIINN